MYFSILLSRLYSVLRWPYEYLLAIKYYYYYKKLSPRPNEIIWVNPDTIEYSIARQYIPDDSPPYGILEGSWDLQKTPWRDSMWDGLREHFEENKDWKKTRYYQFCTGKLYNGEKTLGPNDNTKTIDEFHEYLHYLDQLYSNIKNNGYDDSSVISVDIGRNGEWMCNHGNHRRTLAVIADIECIPVKIRYRHRKWQQIRIEIANTDNLTDLDPHLRKFLNHPDIQQVINN